MRKVCARKSEDGTNPHFEHNITYVLMLLYILCTYVCRISSANTVSESEAVCYYRELSHAISQLFLLQFSPQHIVQLIEPVGELLDVGVL